MNINWKIRLTSKTFWISMTSLLLVLANQVAAIFGMDITMYNEQVTNLVETVLSILGLIGVIVDPTTKGLSDSKRAMDYNERGE